MSDLEHGTRFEEASANLVDAWSREVFAACRTWPLARQNRWFRSDEGYLRLRIEKVDGEPLEPVSVIEMDTSEERVLLDFGSWATPLSSYNRAPNWGATQAVEEARDLVEGWLRGDVRLASYSDGGGWRGSKIIESGSLPDAIEPVPVQIGEGAAVIVKTVRRSDWQYWRRAAEGFWVRSEESES